MRTPRRRAPVVATVVALTMCGAGVGALAATATGDVLTAESTVPAGAILEYAFDQTSGSIANDTSGNGNDATLVGAASWNAGDGVTFDGASGYVKMPDGVLAGLDAISVDFDVRIDAGQASPYFIYGFGNTSGTYGNGYLYATGDSYRTSIASGNWSTEQTTTKGAALARGVWKHLTYTQSGSTGILYEDGVEVARNTAVTLTPGSIGSGTTTANYIGRSLYSGDSYLKGSVREFRVYNRALAASEVAGLAAPVTQAAVAADLASLSLGDTSAVTGNLQLPTGGPNGTTITWSSSDSAVIASDGTTMRPAYGSGDAVATLTATVSMGAVSATTTFEVTVPVEASSVDRAAVAAESVTVTNIEDVRGNITLPRTGLNGASLTWTSSNPAVITAGGDVTRPSYGSSDATVTLSVTATVQGESATRARTATVRALPLQADDAAYVFTYFTGNTIAGEKIYFAASNGNTALDWNELNGGNPVLTSSLGTKGLRDPFLIRSPEGDRFYLIATDLSIGSGTTWDASQRTGSRSVEIWESTDLVNWSAQRHVQVSPATAGNTWAPEAYYDESIGAYVVFWASKLYAESDTNHTGSSYNRMLYSTTRDFVTFTEAQIWRDEGVSVIDSTVIKEGNTYYRFTKDEASASGCVDIIEDKSTDLRAVSPSSSWTVVATCIGRDAGTGGVEGPSIFKANPGDTTGTGYYLFVDEYSGRGYLPLVSPTLDHPTWTMPGTYNLPTSPRHGTALGITQAQWDVLVGG